VVLAQQAVEADEGQIDAAQHFGLSERVSVLEGRRFEPRPAANLNR
jgi:hypothetical protein